MVTKNSFAAVLLPALQLDTVFISLQWIVLIRYILSTWESELPFIVPAYRVDLDALVYVNLHLMYRH